MEPAEYDYMFHLEDAYWWYVGMRRIARTLLQRQLRDGRRGLRILDAGAGTGGSLQLLKDYGEVTAFDFAPQAAEMYARREKGRICVASIDSIPFRDNSFDLVTSFDVVCQLEETSEQAAFRELWRVLRPGGGLMVRVPAFQFLHGPHDVVLHTRHRYSAGEMAAKLAGAGFRDVKTTYANTFLFPVALARRLASKALRMRPTDSDVRPVPGPVNAAFTAVLTLESAILSRTRLPFGLSVIAVATKP
ncbi:MAG TPA: methyltransferase domain-containing protein [Dehalococcoidia bacterium]|nr:methyltransferase domain-containing protein [Dehalococcoidia bacterium]